jgi:hypothetical protein
MKTIGALSLGVTMLIGLNAVYAGGESVEIGGLTSKAPANWKMQKPSNKLRIYQFAVPKVDGDADDAELAVFSFGASGKEENLKRWKSQFIAPAGKTIDEASKVEEYKLGKVADVVVLDISGTFKYKKAPQDPKEKEQLKPEYRRFNVMLTTDKETYFITLTGPEKTMAKNKEAFDGWLKAFKK